MMTDSDRPQQKLAQAAGAARTFACGTASDVDVTQPPAATERRQQVHAAETRLLYENSTTGIVASLLIALALAYTQRNVTATPVVDAWLVFVLVVAAARFAITRLYWRAAPGEVESRRWNNLFVAGTALASAAWGVA